MGRDAYCLFWRCVVSRFQSTLPAWGETTSPAGAPGAEQISIHSPCMGRDNQSSPSNSAAIVFQSTLPAWGETAVHVVLHHRRQFQSTLPAWGETGLRHSMATVAVISIHSPCMGRDGRAPPDGQPVPHFNPLSLHGERPGGAGHHRVSRDFNPLSLHGERRADHRGRRSPGDFNPLSLHGERLTGLPS